VTRPPPGLALGFHAVRTALEEHPRRVERLLLARGRRDQRTRRLVELARRSKVPFQQVPKDALDRLAGGVRHQGVAARLAGTELLTADELMERLPARPLVVVADGVTDPRNLGAIARSAAAFGADGLFLPGHRSAGLGPAAVRTAAGAFELLPVARAGNVGRLLERLDELGVEPVALDPAGGVAPWEAELAGGVAIVAGGEEQGVRRSVLDRCRVRISIPIREAVGSLNVSVAVGIVLADLARRRHETT